MRDALVVVDFQVDFCTGGALAAHDTESAVGEINALIAGYASQGRLVVFTRDWHPADHASFRERGGPWPAHCVRNTPGAELHPALDLPPCYLLVSKAVRADKEAYSGFEDTALAGLLRNLGIESLALCGIATEYCVLATFEDALKSGFGAAVYLRAIRPVEPCSEAEKKALERFAEAGDLIV